MRGARAWSLTLKLWRCSSFSSSSEKLAENMNLKMRALMALCDREIAGRGAKEKETKNRLGEKIGKGAAVLGEVHRITHVRVGKSVDAVLIMAKKYWSCDLSKRSNKRSFRKPVV